ncbi:MAG: alpha/beta fold hydrolase [Acidimicrobiia bacterium]|nr:alpha/beta fold hydrolase [Acidimicrobiia bacterium]
MASSQHVDIPGVRVHYLQQGSGPEAVVLLHGFPQTSHQWRHQLRALAEAGYACFAPDNRGFGGTDKPDVRISRALLARDVTRFMDAVGLESAHVVAHDWGGIIAFKLVADHPQRVRSIALLDTLLTVWPPQAVHGWWFKAEGLPEALFAAHHRTFIEVAFGGRDAADLPGAPASPWARTGLGGTGGGRPAWVDAESLDHYLEAFSDPASWAAAIQYYRYGLPFHLVDDGGGAERYRCLSEREVGAMWLHEGGFDAHPDRWRQHDVAPEDRSTRFEQPALWLQARGRERGRRAKREPAGGRSTTAPASAFVAQFAQCFGALATQGVASGHFLAEEAPDEVNAALLGFLGPAGGGRA